MDSGDNIDNVYVITGLGIGHWTLIWLSTTAWPLVAAQTTKFSMALGGSSMVQHKHPNGPKWQYGPWTSTQSQTAVRPRTQILYLAETQGWTSYGPKCLVSHCPASSCPIHHSMHKPLHFSFSPIFLPHIVHWSGITLWLSFTCKFPRHQILWPGVNFLTEFSQSILHGYYMHILQTMQL